MNVTNIKLVALLKGLYLRYNIRERFSIYLFSSLEKRIP